MIRRVYAISIFYILSNCFSCVKPPCECDFEPFRAIEFKLTNQQGTNLVFGPNAIYNVDSIRVWKQRNNPDVHNASVRKGFIDTAAVRFAFYVHEEKSYVYYNHIDSPDSLEIKWQTKTGKCCEVPQEYQTVESLKFNGLTVVPVAGIYTFKK